MNINASKQNKKPLIDQGGNDNHQPKFNILPKYFFVLIFKNYFFTPNKKYGGAQYQGNNIGPLIMCLPKIKKAGQKKINREIKKRANTARDKIMKHLPT